MAEETYNVILLNNDDKMLGMLNIINIVMRSLNQSPKNSNDLVGGKDCVLAENVSAEIAYALKQGIEAAGGKVRIISSTQEANEKRKVRETVISNFNDINTNQEYTSSKETKEVEKKRDQNLKTLDQSERMPRFTAPEEEERVSKSWGPDFNTAIRKLTATNERETAPKFTAPNHSDTAPKFTAPNQPENIPRFTAPNEQDSISNHFSSHENCCSYHPNNRAIMKCDSCGRPICSECRDAGELTDGSHVCFDCASAIVQNDVDIAKEKRKKIVIKIVLGVLGAIAFGMISATSGFRLFFQDSGSTPIEIWQILFTLFGASLSIYFPALKAILAWIWRFIRWKPDIMRANAIIENIFSGIKIMLVIFAICGFFLVFSVFLTFSPLVAIVIAIMDFVRYKKADNLVKRNQEILQHLSDRMEYIRIQSEENADIESFANDVRMQNNQFAQRVRREGYAGASKVFADEAKEMAENDKKIKKFVINEYGEAVRAA